MPLYEFKCQNCGETAEEILPMSRADTWRKCRKCTGTMKRVIFTAPAVCRREHLRIPVKNRKKIRGIK